MDESLIFPLKKKSKDLQKGYETDTSNFIHLIEDVFKNELFEWSEDNYIKNVFGDDVEQLIRHIYKVSMETAGSVQNDKVIRLFARLKDYYRFFIDESNIAYSSKFVQFDNKKEMFVNYDPYFSEILTNCLEELNKHSYDFSPEKLFHILLLHLHERSCNFMPQLKLKYQDTSRNDISENDKRRYNVVLNEYLKSELRTWNVKLLESYNNFHFGLYPYCKFVRINSQYIVLLIVSYLDRKYINEKIEEIDIIEPIHMLIFEDDESLFQENFIRNLEFTFKHIIANINYGQLGYVTNNSLKILVEESQETSRYWYTEGINQIFNELKLQRTEEHKGMLLAQTAIEKLLCSDLNSLISTEAFPFNRIYIFPDSNFKAGKLNRDLDFHPGISNDKIMLDMLVFEAGFKSNRPQDNERYLSNMERLDKNDGKNDIGKDPEMPDLERYFDITDKKIIYRSNFKIDKQGHLYSGKLLTEGKVNASELTSINFFDELHKEPDPDESKENFNILKDFDLSKIPINDQNREKIQAVLATLFVGLYGDEDGFDYDDRSSNCQSTYSLYNEDGLCFIADPSVKLGEVPLLNKIQEGYFDEFFKYNGDRWEIIWKDNKTNRPNKDKFLEWLGGVESKVNIISFDPNQSVSNLNEQDGTRYITDVGFTIVFVSDNDLKKNIYNNKTESLDLKQTFTMIIRRLLQEEKNKMNAIKETNELYMTLLPSLMHSAKGYIKDERERTRIDDMVKVIYRLLESENIQLDLLNIDSINGLYNAFFTKLITENLDIEIPATEKITHSWISGELKKSAQEYIEQLNDQDKNKLKTNEPFEFYFNYNFIPSIQIPVTLSFLEEAMKVIFNNAVQHTRLYAIKNNCAPLLIVSTNLSYHSNDSNRGFIEISFINRSESIPPDRLEELNNPNPRRVDKDKRKDNSTGLGLFISRKQLKSTSGEGANIIIKNVDHDLVEAKLILPVTLRKRHENGLSETIEMDNREKISNNIKLLYVEDEPKLKDTSERWLKQILGEDFKQVCTSTNYLDASIIVKNNDLKLVMMDFNILEKADSSSASNKFGIKLLKLIKKHIPSTPVMILSGSSVREIIKLMQDDRIATSHVVEVNTKTKNFSLVKGMIYKTLIKDLSHPGSEFLTQPIKSLFVEQPDETANSFHNLKKPSTQVNISLTDFAGFQVSYDKYYERWKAKSKIDEVLVLHSYAPTINDLFSQIKNWLSIEDQKNLFSIDEDDEDRLKVFRNDYIRTLIHWITVSDDLYASLSIRLKYWALSLNIWITKSDTPDEKGISLWPATPFGIKGPLSKLRHDLKNKITGKEINQLLKDIEAAELQLLFSSEKLFFELEDIIKKDIHEAIQLLDAEPKGNVAAINERLHLLAADLEKNKELKELHDYNEHIETMKYLLNI